MATISVPVLEVTNVDDAFVKVSVKYTLTPTDIEKLAGTVFIESIQVIGNDRGTANDKVISVFPSQNYKVDESTKRVDRTVTSNVAKSRMNEDSGFTARGSEQSDEVFARVTIEYAANPPMTPTLPLPANSNQITGPWRG